MKIAIIIPTPDAMKWPASESIPWTVETVRNHDAEVIPVVSSGPGFTFAKSINIGFRAAPDVDAWVFLNDDCFMDEGWLQNMIEAAEMHPDSGIIGALLKHEDGGIQHAGAYVSKSLVSFHWLRAAIHVAMNEGPREFLRRMLSGRTRLSDHYYRLMDNRIDVVTAACILVTRACFEEIGGFDDDWPLTAFEDVDYCLRARENGIGIVLASNATGLHIEGVAMGQTSTTPGFDMFCRKWSFKRIKAALENGSTGTIHPAFCEHRRTE